MESVAPARSKNHDTTDKEVIYDGAIACWFLMRMNNKNRVEGHSVYKLQWSPSTMLTFTAYL